MADKATGSLSTSVFQDDIKSTMSGSSAYTPVSGDDDAWAFAEVGVTHSGTNILDTSDSYLGLAAAVSLSDKVKWVAIKNISTTSTEGLGISLTGDAAYNTNTTMILGNGEMLVLKTPNLTVEGLHGKSCTLDANGKPSAQGTATVTCQVAAILEDV
tara:strand:- start:10341 stop:10811 length:471 start_codon:yes stop_codon:yes gene_type:complete